MIESTDIVYIAGPMTGKPLYNYPAFFGIAGIIEKEYGCRVLNPARQPNGLHYADYLRLAEIDLARATVVVMLTGWEKSSGARIEYRIAIHRKIRIIAERDLLKELNDRLKEANLLCPIGEIK